MVMIPEQWKKSTFIHLCLAITFFTSGVIVNLIQCLFYLTIRPFNKRLYRKINWYLCFTIYSQLVFLGDWWSGSRIIFYINRDEFDKYYGKEHAYCVMNHTYEIDWLVGWMICDRISLLGNCKAYAKKVIQYIPVLGWGWKCSEFVFLERSFEKDKEVINRQITMLADHPDPMWLLLFPEGTRFTPEKHKISLDFAKQKGLPELKHHLLPRTRGFIASLPSMHGKVPALYDIEICFKENEPKPTIMNLLFGKSVTAHMYMRRIRLEELPKTEAEQEDFLRQMFVRKDKLRESFIKTGDYFATSNIPRLEPFEINRRVNSVYNMIFWTIAILCPITYYLLRLFFRGEIVYFSIGVSIIGASTYHTIGRFWNRPLSPPLNNNGAVLTELLTNHTIATRGRSCGRGWYRTADFNYFYFAFFSVYLLLNKMIGMSEIKKGSSYGTNTPKKNN